jgi:hypothetical protein
LAGVQNLKRARDDKSKAIVLAMMAWSCLFMLNAAMRLAAASFMFGLAFVSLVPEHKVLLKTVWSRTAVAGLASRRRAAAYLAARGARRAPAATSPNA